MIVGRGEESSLDSVLSRTPEEALTCDCHCHCLQTYQACFLYALRFFTFVNIKRLTPPPTQPNVPW
jgi:hypothetical protein